jgi:hypothetical protein
MKITVEYSRSLIHTDEIYYNSKNLYSVRSYGVKIEWGILWLAQLRNLDEIICISKLDTL